MHILMLLDHNYPPDQRVENEAESLVQNGFEVTILSVGRDARPEIEELKGVRIHRFDIPNQVRKKLRATVGFFDLYSHLIYRFAKKSYGIKSFDAVHAHDLYLVNAGIKIKEKFDIPLIADLHENYVGALSQYAWSTRFPGSMLTSTKRWEKYEREWLKKSDVIISVISEMKKRYTDLGFSDKKIIVVPNTPNIKGFRDYPINNEILHKFKDRKIILYSGGFDLHRGLETAIKAMPLVVRKHKDALLLLVGDGRNKPELIQLRDDLGLENAVKFEGWQDQNNIRSYVRSATIGLIPHVRSVQTDASIPHKLGYYMSEELPVISSNCTSLKRMVNVNDAGIIFESKNEEDLSKKINFLLSNPEEAHRLAKNGKKAVEKEFNWDSTVQPMIEFYTRLKNLQT
ncbi:MAG: glycosyltransferase family 4 protein [Balneola sp.]